MRSKLALITEAAFEAQPNEVRSVVQDVRDQLVVSYERIDGRCVPLSFYGEDDWLLTGGTSNERKHRRRMNFRTLPLPFREIVKEMAWRLLRRGREGGSPYAASRLRSWFTDSRRFLAWLDGKGIKRLSDVSPMVCLQYTETEKSRLSRYGKPIASTSLTHAFQAIEAIHELSQFTQDPMPASPWSESSAIQLSGASSTGIYTAKTPLIPDGVFSTLFEAAWDIVAKADDWLDLREGLNRIEAEFGHLTKGSILVRKNRFLASSGWIGGLKTFNIQLIKVRTACYIVVASLSGCRNHELAYIQSAPFYSTTDNEGGVFWWMKSRSEKTGEGNTEWMIPEAAVKALRVMERWAKPYQAMVADEIMRRRKVKLDDLEIAEAIKHRNALFLGESLSHRNLVRTLSVESWNRMLNDFAKTLGIEWKLATHQFRRKFANYAARSRFGDLRYLKDHFKHWSMDMTLCYALNESQDIDLYLDIEAELDGIKVDVVEEWLQDDVPLAGGFGTNIVKWRGTAPMLFKDRAAMVRSLADSISLRSTLHAWCAADSGDCAGPDVAKLVSCTDCDNGVIHQRHAHIYQRQYQELKLLLDLEDIGEAGLNRVKNAMGKCRDVLERLRIDSEGD